MNIYKPIKTRLSLKYHRKQVKSLTLDDMIGKYKAMEPINCVELKHKLK